jgi:hypothetical protein
VKQDGLQNLFDAIVELTKNWEFENSGGLRFRSSQCTADGVVLDLFLVPGNGSNEQHWQIECSGVRDYLLRNEFCVGLHVVSEHPLLLPFTEQVTKLYFYSASPNPIATVGALFECHRALVDTWIPFERFINVLPKKLSQLLAASSGLLADGPVSLMEAYSCVLGEHGIHSSMLPSQSPKFWDGEKWVVSNVPLQAVIFESSYVVADRFNAKRLTV